MDLFDELRWRGVAQDATDELELAFAREPVTAYIGFDPSASSLHVGSLLPVMGLARLQQHGHSPIAIIGGGTGLIGDPSGKSNERLLLTTEQVEANLLGIRAQLSRFLDFDAQGNAAQIINNADWLLSITTMDFLRDVGKHFTVNYMLAKESVRRRIDSEDGAVEEGISFTEFSYMLLQAYDFLVLYDRFGCTLQMGGSDQWGNITAGIELIRRVRGVRAHGLVFPLITTAAGTKFGKTEAGTIWLDSQRTSPFKFYQFWYNTDDRDVINYLKYFTWLTQDEVADLKVRTAKAPDKRDAQRVLAGEVTRIVHGESALANAERTTQSLFGTNIKDLTEQEVLDVFSDIPSAEVPRSRFDGQGMPVLDLLLESGMVQSKSSGRKLISQGGAYLNNERIESDSTTIDLSQCIARQFFVLRSGQKQYHLVRVTGA